MINFHVVESRIDSASMTSKPRSKVGTPCLEGVVLQAARKDKRRSLFQTGQKVLQFHEVAFITMITKFQKMKNS